MQKFINDKETQIEFYCSDGKPDKVFIKAHDLEKNPDTDFFRNYLSEFFNNVTKENFENLYIKIPPFECVEKVFVDEMQYLISFIEGIYLGLYKFDKYKKDQVKSAKLNIELSYPGEIDKLKDAVKRSEIVMSSVFFTRDLVNEPAITLTPAEYENIAKSELKKVGVKVSVLNKTQLEKKKMNAILAVGNASVHEPRLIVMNYKPKGKVKRKIALVGKGVTYDSGGLSIKPTSGMLEMKADMAGSAVVMGVIKAAAELKLKVEIIGFIPAVENMVSGSSYKPGDVIRSYSGKSIEIKDTDAEGRSSAC